MAGKRTQPSDELNPAAETNLPVIKEATEEALACRDPEPVLAKISASGDREVARAVVDSLLELPTWHAWRLLSFPERSQRRAMLGRIRPQRIQAMVQRRGQALVEHHARRVVAGRTREERREALAQVPEAARPLIEARARNLWEQR